jgi:hypothetical protein
MDANHFFSILDDSQKRLNDMFRKSIFDLLNCQLPSEKIKILKNMINEIDFFKRVLKKEDYPDWLKQIDILIKKTDTNNFNKNTLPDLYNNIELSYKQKWPFSVDFEEIYKHYRSESKLEELFDKLIELLEEIIKNKELKEDIVINGIKKIIELVKYNQGKSYYSDEGLIKFIFIFLKNIAIETIKKIPGMDIILNSLGQTVRDIAAELDNIHKKTASKIEDESAIQIRYLKNGFKELESQNNLQLIDITV